MRIHDKNKFENSYKVWPSRPQHQIILCCSYIITLITSILEFLMNWFNVNPQKSQITWIHNFCLDWFNISLQMSLFHNHVKQIPGADSLAHCPPCEERWDGPPDLTWELVSICIHDNKQLYHTHTHFRFNHIVDGMTPPEQDWGEMLITNIIYFSPLAFQFYIFRDKAIEWPKFIFQLWCENVFSYHYLWNIW